MIKSFNKKLLARFLSSVIGVVSVLSHSSFVDAQELQLDTTTEDEIVALIDEAYQVFMETEHETNRFPNGSVIIREYIEVGRLDKAVDVFDNTPRIRLGEDENASCAIINAMLRADRHDDAMELMERWAPSLEGGTVYPVWRNYALDQVVRHYVRVKDFDRALEATQMMKSERPTVPGEVDSDLRYAQRVAYSTIANGMFENGAPEEAFEFIKRHYDMTPTNTLFGFVQRSGNLGYFDIALRELDQLAVFSQKKALYELHDGAIKGRQFEFAMDLVRKALEIDLSVAESLVSVSLRTAPTPKLFDEFKSELLPEFDLPLSPTLFSGLVRGHIRHDQLDQVIQLLNGRGEEQVLADVNLRFANWISELWSQQGESAARTYLGRLENPGHLNNCLYYLARNRLVAGDQESGRALAVELADWVMSEGEKPKVVFRDYQLANLLIDADEHDRAIVVAPVRESSYRSSRQAGILQIFLDKGNHIEAVEYLINIAKSGEWRSVDSEPAANLGLELGLEHLIEVCDSIAEPGEGSTNKLNLQNDFVRILSRLIDAGQFEMANDFWAFASQKLDSRGENDFSSSSWLYLIRGYKWETKQWELISEMLPDADEMQRFITIKFAKQGLVDKVIQRVTTLESHQEHYGSVKDAWSFLLSGGHYDEVQKYAKSTEDTVLQDMALNTKVWHLSSAGLHDDALDLVRNIQEPYERANQLLAVARNKSYRELNAVRKILNWLEETAQFRDNKVYWPVAIENDQVSHDLYSGTAGILLFLEEAMRENGNYRMSNLVSHAGRTLCDEVSLLDENSDPGFYTGYSGIGFALLNTYVKSAHNHHVDAGEVRRAILRCIELLDQSAIEMDSDSYRAIHWNDSTDLISGSAGIGWFLITASDRFERALCKELAIAAADGLLLNAQSFEEQGIACKKWMMNSEFDREMPNYSHGTAGVCEFLIAAHNLSMDKAFRTDMRYDGRFLEAAQQGANYLRLISNKHSGNGLIPHHFPEGEDLFYLGWCHGPVGTCMLLDQMHLLESESNWSQLSDAGKEYLLGAGLSRDRTAGFWNNVGICCGSSGVASFFVDQFQVTQDQRYWEESQKIVSDILSRGVVAEASNGFETLHFPQAEHRLRPDLIQSQTGLMQGASGVGMMLLQIHKIREGEEYSVFKDVLK